MELTIRCQNCQAELDATLVHEAIYVDFCEGCLKETEKEAEERVYNALRPHEKFMP